MKKTTIRKEARKIFVRNITFVVEYKFIMSNQFFFSNSIKVYTVARTMSWLELEVDDKSIHCCGKEKEGNSSSCKQNQAKSI